MEFLEYGALGLLAAVMFFGYRQLVTQLRDDRKYMEERLTGVIKDYNEATYGQRDVVIKHTAVLSELITWLKAKNGS